MYLQPLFIYINVGFMSMLGPGADPGFVVRGGA